MTLYADYKFYTDDYLGRAIPAEAFPRYVRDASKYIDNVTFGRINGDVTEDVKMACCAVAEEMYAQNVSGANAVSGKASESIGDYSVSYSGMSADREKILSARLYSAVLKWLDGTNLMYRGR